MKKHLFFSKQFILILVLSGFFGLISTFCFSQTSSEISGHITSDTTWTTDTIKVTGDIYIDSSYTLTIIPGTYIEFQGHYKIEVNGQLLANGTHDEMITFTINDTTGFSNTTNQDGGWNAIRFNSTPVQNDTSVIEYCKFEYSKNLNNVGTFSNYGGAISITNFSKVKIRNNNFINNIAEKGGAISCVIANIEILQNFFIMNNAQSGGALYIYYSSPHIGSNTFFNNYADYGGAISIDWYSNPNFVNNIIWNNHANASGNQVYTYCITNSGYHSVFKYCDIQGGLSGFGGSDVCISYVNYTNNINKEPLFIDVNDNNYHLSNNSPCINAGTPDTTGLNLLSTDIEGNARISEDIIDIGAYEYQKVLSVSGHISQNTTWNADTMKVTGDIYIDYPYTLNICPGTYVEFQGHYKIEVTGQLLANGTHDDMITFTINDTTGFSNTTNQDGGWNAIRFTATPVQNDTSVIEYCKFEYSKNLNNVSMSNYGGAISISNFSKVKIRNNNFINNIAEKGGAISCNDNANVEILQNLFTGNNAETGGAILIMTSSPLIGSNTFFNNYADYGGAIEIDYSDPSIINNIIWNNNADMSGNQVYITSHDYTPVFLYCDIEGGVDEFGGITDSVIYEYNINQNPLFINDSNYHLLSNSPCINAGIPDSLEYNFPLFDFDGNLRPDSIPVTIGMCENLYPYLKKQIDAKLVKNVGSILINLNDYFDFNGIDSTLNFTLSANCDTNTTTIKIINDTLKVFPKTNLTGIDTAIIKATTNYGTFLIDTVAINVFLDTIGIIKPANGYTFSIHEDKYFKWNKPNNLISGQELYYYFKITIVEEGQSPEEAINNEIWYETTTGTAVFSGQMGVIVDKHFSSGYIFAWQVTAFSSDSLEFAKSNVNIVKAPPFVNSFRSGNHKIYVNQTTVQDLNNLAGYGWTMIDTDTVYVHFENLKIESVAGELWLRDGQIYAEYNNTIIIEADNQNNFNSQFTADSAMFNKDGLGLYGKLKVDLSIPNNTQVSNTVIINDYFGFDNYKLTGDVELGDNYNFDLIETGEFELELLNTSKFIINNNTYSCDFEGSVYNNSNNITTYFKNANNLYYFTYIYETNENNKWDIVDSLITINPQKINFDFSEAISPGIFNNNKSWKGIYFDKFKISFSTLSDENNHFNIINNIEKEYTTWWGANKYWITKDSIEFNVIDNFNTSNLAKFQAFDGYLSEFKIDIINNSFNESYIKGEINIPFISETNNYAYTIPINENGLGTGELDTLINDFTFNSYEHAFTSFTFPDYSPIIAGEIDEESKTIIFDTPEDFDITNMKAYFINSGVKVTIDDINQVRAVTPNDFSYYKLYTITSGDGSQQVYKVMEADHTGNSVNDIIFADIILVYPNPTEGIFTLEGKNIQTIEIFNINGKSIIKKQLKCNSGNMLEKINLDLTNQLKGIYFIKILTKTGLKIKKLILL